ncbi:HAMP domain-containing sensor histidine kinase [Enterococcus sp. LJL120]
MINRKQVELKGPSLTVKWALASSFFIFVVFTIFAVITYQRTVSLMASREQANAETTMTDTVARLAQADQELSTSSVVTYLFNSADEVTDNSNDQTVYEIDGLYSELGQEDLNLTIFDLSEEPIFQTQAATQDFAGTDVKEADITTISNETGLLSVEPIRSVTTNQVVGYAQIFYSLSSFYEIRERLLLTLVVLEIISLILSSFLGFLLSSYFLKPLKVLRNTMEIIRNDPESDARMPEIKTNDELADISENFNEMLDRMKLYIESQKQFVEDVSHELRTPVAVIEGHLSMLNRWGKDDPEILQESILASLQEISRMKTLVQEMLDLSRAQQSEILYKNETSKAKEVIYQVFNNFKILYPEFTFTLDDDLHEEVDVKIYRNHFEQLIIIILDNAVKYSTNRKEVHISISRNSTAFELAIQDFGEGITEEDLKKIFNRFYRVDKARARTKGGNGLGLSIAKQLVENYKGTISVDSSVGHGTIFRITLPLVVK